MLSMLFYIHHYLNLVLCAIVAINPYIKGQFFVKFGTILIIKPIHSYKRIGVALFILPRLFLYEIKKIVICCHFSASLG